MYNEHVWLSLDYMGKGVLAFPRCNQRNHDSMRNLLSGATQSSGGPSNPLIVQLLPWQYHSRLSHSRHLGCAWHIHQLQTRLLLSGTTIRPPPHNTLHFVPILNQGMQGNSYLRKKGRMHWALSPGTKLWTSFYVGASRMCRKLAFGGSHGGSHTNSEAIHLIIHVLIGGKRPACWRLETPMIW